MRLTKLNRKKTLLISLGLLTAVNVIAACTTASKITICVMNPVKGEAVCNKTGKPEDNYALPIDQMENYIALPPRDAQTVLQRLKTCEKRTGD